MGKGDKCRGMGREHGGNGRRLKRGDGER